MTAQRPWCAKATFPGLAPFIGGTITMPADAQHHEIEAALVAHFLTFLPPGFTIIEPMCGALFFNGEMTTAPKLIRGPFLDRVLIVR